MKEKSITRKTAVIKAGGYSPLSKTYSYFGFSIITETKLLEFVAKNPARIVAKKGVQNPKLLSIRLHAKEEENDQKLVLKLSGLMFISGFIISGLNYRYNWITLPNYIIVVSSIIFIISYIMYGIVLYQNTYLSRKIEVLDKHQVIDTGLYKIVRHPMYTITIFLFLSMPLILNSIISFIIFLSYIPIINIRIKNEEKVLEKNLKGYKEYMKKVKYKLIPYVY